jgi:signal transduction histidine kinase
LGGQSFVRAPHGTKLKVGKVIPTDAITALQSLKPYVRSLSHELRTPMQGVVGMLDVMHATVQEAIEGQPNSKVRNVFQALKENIEVVQGMASVLVAHSFANFGPQTVRDEQLRRLIMLSTPMI